MALKWFKKRNNGRTNIELSNDSADRDTQKEQAIPEQNVSPEINEPEKYDTQVHSDLDLEPKPKTDPMEKLNRDRDKSYQPGKEDFQSAALKKGLFSRLKNGLSKTRNILTTDIDDLFTGKNQIDDDFLEELEELLITSDIGVQPATELMRKVHKKASRLGTPEALKAFLREQIQELLKNTAPSSETETASEYSKPHVIMVVGVNGVGKTTTIGKLSAKAAQQDKSVLIVAADTFRAAAIEQLSIWAQRSGADIVKHKENADPSAVVFDGMKAASARGADVVFIDTAGRLHTKVNLMEELKKIKRTISKKIPGAPHEVLLVLDATTGQNALTQAQLFHEKIGITCLALTKLDGTAKGGIVIRICETLNVPLRYIGVGESIEDLQTFDPQQFVDALF
ncbi:MAG: signal recognition particle-docking protein FtsY [Desulfobacteraceae bacterium]|nr:signal recognition particle-docking protein FtsY [Desulfobacteraceae bacterium]